MLHTRPDAAQVDRVDPVEDLGLLVGGVGWRSLDACVIEREVESAEARDGAFHKRGDLLFVGHIADDAVRLPASIVNCSSLGGLVGLPGRAAYHASKHGVIGLTRSAAPGVRAPTSAATAECPACSSMTSPPPSND